MGFGKSLKAPSMGASGFVEGFGKEAPETSETACF